MGREEKIEPQRGKRTKFLQHLTWPIAMCFKLVDCIFARIKSTSNLNIPFRTQIIVNCGFIIVFIEAEISHIFDMSLYAGRVHLKTG